MKPDLHAFPPTALAAKPRVIVCERKAVWAMRLRSHLPPEAAMRQTRLLEECGAELALAPASFLVVEALGANLVAVLELLSLAGRQFPLARVAVVAERKWEPLGEVLREAGAVYFSTSPRSADIIARMAVRHLQRAPQPRLPLATRIWESLPWQEAATG
jgi:hypothetical protein